MSSGPESSDTSDSLVVARESTDSGKDIDQSGDVGDAVAVSTVKPRAGRASLVLFQRFSITVIAGSPLLSMTSLPVGTSTSPSCTPTCGVMRVKV
jgi:hypothetical protein